MKARGKLGNNWRNNSWEVWSWIWQNERAMCLKSAFALMQKCKIFNAANEERPKLVTLVVAKTHKKQSTIAWQLRTCNWGSCLTDDVKRIGDGAREFDSRFVVKGIRRKSQLTVNLTITIIWPSKSSQQTRTPAGSSPRSSKKVTNLRPHPTPSHGSL